jgi:hypothetical protein
MSDASKSPTVDVFFFSNEGKRGKWGVKKNMKRRDLTCPPDNNNSNSKQLRHITFCNTTKIFTWNWNKRQSDIFFFKKEEKHN